MNNLTFSINKVTGLSMRFLSVLFCLFVVCATAEAGNTFKYNYSVTVAPQTSNPGRGKVYMDAKAEFLYDNKTKWADLSDSKNTELYNANKTLTVSVSKNNEDKDNQKNPWIQYTSVTLKAEALAGSKFTKWSWTENSEEKSSTAVTISIPCPERLQMNPNDRDDTESRSCPITYTAHFTPRTYNYKIPGAQTTEGGTICATGTTSTRPEDEDAQWSDASILQGSTLSQNADGNGMYARATIGTYYYHAKANNDYKFLGWYDKNGIMLTADFTCPYELIATSEESATPTTDMLTAVFVPATPATITYKDVINPKYDKFWTGTEKGAADGGIYAEFPYRTKTAVDLKKTFGTDEKPLFHVLYIFGVTTDVSGGDEINLPAIGVACNAKTPCYVYHKSDDGTHYVYKTTFDAVSTRFDHGTAMNTKHLYFTGYCPFANVGTTPDHEGWMYFRGDGNGVNIYLDNCEILGRGKTVDGSIPHAGYHTTYEVLLEIDVLSENGVLAGKDQNSFLKGSSSIFVFNSTTTNSAQPYSPSIHISGDNHLKGQTGHITEVYGYAAYTKIELNTIIGYDIENVPTASAPITIKADNTFGYTNLTMDDLWPTGTEAKAITNGSLLLDSYRRPGELSETTPVVEMGTQNSTLTINGGQYMLRNSAADGAYTCNLAVGYRKFTKTASVMGMNPVVALYGFGGDRADCQVAINAGTFTMYPNMYYDGSKYLGSNYYVDQDGFLDLRLPAGKGTRYSYINGGTYNGISNVVFCSVSTSSGASPINQSKDMLCLQDVEVDGLNLDQNNGSVTFTIPAPFSSAYSNTEPCYNLATGIGNVESNAYYGGQSINGDTKKIGGKTVVSLLLPASMCEDEDVGEYPLCANCELLEEAIYYNWATAAPRLQIQSSGINAEIGGDIVVPVNVNTGEATIKAIVNNLLYFDMQGIEGESIGSVGFATSKAWGSVENEGDYWIRKQLNILKNVVADRWYCFVAPFDIHVVSVLECGDMSDYADDRNEARRVQAENNMTFLISLQDFVFPDENGRASGISFEELVTGSPVASLYPLKHYNGTSSADKNHGENIFNANYYLYEMPDGEFQKETTKDGTRDTFNIAWQPVHREGEAGEALLRKGKVYAMQFPWCPMCNDWQTRTKYDYWTNKVIHFLGLGYDNPGTETDGQIVRGRTYQGETILAQTPSVGAAMHTGNSTLFDMTAPANAYVHDCDVDQQTGQDWFIQPPEEYVVKPTQGYMLYNSGPDPMPVRISRAGQIEYSENNATGVDGVPTIGDRTSLMLFGAYDGFEVLALHEQLVTVYNLQGNIIFQQYMAEGQQVYVATGAGVFIVRGESETIKVMVE